jgi:hypothetical protein
MSHFLQNLLDRHQECAVSHGVSRKVQPRPKSRFESDSGLVSFAQNDLGNGADFTPVNRTDWDDGSFTAEYDQVARSNIIAEDSQSGQSTPVSAQHSFEKSTIQPNFSQQQGDLNERVKTTAQSPGQHSSTVREALGLAVENKNDKQTEYLREKSETPPHVAYQQQFLSDEINPRIQTILHRLNSSHPQQTDDPRPIDTQHNSEPKSEAENNALVSETNARVQTTLHRLTNQQVQDRDDPQIIEPQHEPVSSIGSNATANEISPHIQTILQRLNNQHNPQSLHAEDQRTIESRHEQVKLSDTPNNTPVGKTNETSHRIQTILQRLNNPLPQHQDRQQADQSQRITTPDREYVAPMSALTSPLTAELNTDFIQPADKLKKQSIENRLEHYELEQAGAMRIPDWLSDMQADFNARWQRINTQTKSEPVINVTIGRIEVRAVQAETTKKPKAHHKPSGVMSLDDYLKQREKRGR